ncbi:MAG: type II toxin-antitoxin system PemK/MazF family toxin [Clostridia bacterium]|nr:type II toxin-antitoxin system PemK/MazF family toxin [Clostridia bacterium]
MLREDWIFKRGDVYLAELDARIGFVQGGKRPVIVLQNNCGNFYAPTLIVAPLTSNVYKKRNFPTHYYLDNDAVLYPSIVMLEQITTIDKRQVQKYVGKVSRREMEEINECIEKSLGIYIPEEMEAP